MPHKSILLAFKTSSLLAFATTAAAITAHLAPQRLSERLSECPQNDNYNGRECVCDRGFERTREGCVEPTTTVRCGRNEVPNSRGGCDCDRGSEMTQKCGASTLLARICLLAGVAALVLAL